MAYVGGESPRTSDCFICDAIGGSDPEAKLVVARADGAVTLLNRFPYSPGHALVAPTRHAPDMRDLSVDEGAALFAATQRTMRAIEAALHPDGFNVGLNVGAAAGASVEHVHLHVVPRWAGDTNFMPVLADVKVLPEHLDATVERLREAFAKLTD